MNRNFDARKQQALLAALSTFVMILTSGWAKPAPPPLQTQRDRELEQILSETSDATSHPLLSERNAQLNILKRAYLDRLNRPDWAGELFISNNAGWGSSKKFFNGMSGIFRNVLQFSENLQLQSAWSFSGAEKGLVPVQFRADSDLPTLDHLLVSYGKMRSIEVAIGLPEENAILFAGAARSIFSGITMTLHPLEQKLFPSATQYSFQLEHGWASLLAAPNDGPSRRKLQRTRPRFQLQWKFPSIELKTFAALEWYSDSEGILGQLTSHRPNALAEIRNSAERRWRLLQANAEVRFSPLADLTAVVIFERVSNTIGSSSSPAWSLSSSLERQFLQSGNTFTAQLGVVPFRSPGGSIPPQRLPLEVTPGSQGIFLNAGARAAFAQLSNHEFHLKINSLTERQSQRAANLHCTIWQQTETQKCSFYWLSLAWSLKLPTNL